MPDSKKIRARRNLLWDLRGGLCHWCGRKTIKPHECAQDHPLMATIDHLQDRYSPRRREPPQPGEERLVLSCQSCNQKRARESEIAFWQRERALNGSSQEIEAMR